MSVKQEDIDKAIVREDYYTVGVKTTVCVLTLENGFEVIGHSGCVNPYDYDISVGGPIAKQRAVDKVWQLLGFMNQMDEWRNQQIIADIQAEAQLLGLYDRPEAIQGNVLDLRDRDAAVEEAAGMDEMTDSEKNG